MGVDYTLRFENLQQDWEGMFEELNIDTPKLPYVNVSNKKKIHYSEYYNNSKTKSEIIDLVHIMFEKDFRYFNYKFEEKKA